MYSIHGFQGARRTNTAGRWFLTAATALLCFAGSLSLTAQVGTASVSGIVEDSTGAAIPGATVTLTDNDTQTNRTLHSDSSGFFSFANLPAKSYTATFHSAGFTDLVRRDIVVHMVTR